MSEVAELERESAVLQERLAAAGQELPLVSHQLKLPDALGDLTHLEAMMEADREAL